MRQGDLNIYPGHAGDFQYNPIRSTSFLHFTDVGTKAQRGCHVMCKAAQYLVEQGFEPPSLYIVHAASGELSSSPAIEKHLRLCWEGQAKASSYSGGKAPYQFTAHLRQGQPRQRRILSWCLAQPMPRLGVRCFCCESTKAERGRNWCLAVLRHMVEPAPPWG